MKWVRGGERLVLAGAGAHRTLLHSRPLPAQLYSCDPGPLCQAHIAAYIMSRLLLTRASGVRRFPCGELGTHLAAPSAPLSHTSPVPPRTPLPTPTLHSPTVATLSAAVLYTAAAPASSPVPFFGPPAGLPLIPLPPSPIFSWRPLASPFLGWLGMGRAANWAGWRRRKRRGDGRWSGPGRGCGNRSRGGGQD